MFNYPYLLLKAIHWDICKLKKYTYICTRRLSHLADVWSKEIYNGFRLAHLASADLDGLFNSKAVIVLPEGGVRWVGVRSPIDSPVDSQSYSSLAPAHVEVIHFELLSKDDFAYSKTSGPATTQRVCTLCLQLRRWKYTLYFLGAGIILVPAIRVALTGWPPLCRLPSCTSAEYNAADDGTAPVGQLYHRLLSVSPGELAFWKHNGAFEVISTVSRFE